MSLYGVKDTTQCRNCGDEFANHKYVPDSIDRYLCPRPQRDSTYGYFTGGDPRDFHPDYECCTPDEIANWKAACERWDSGETNEPEPCPSGWMHVEGVGNVHVTRSPYGIGTQVYEYPTEFEARDSDEEE